MSIPKFDQNNMNQLTVDSEGLASRAAAEGKFALGTGDTILAAEKYAEAGVALEKEANSARKAPQKNLLRFLAASQFFYGGHYTKALKLARRVEERLLPPPVRQLFAPFFRDVKDRTRSDYAIGIRKTVLLISTNQPAAALELLKSHPYVCERSALAVLRALLCEELKQYHAAALFFATALKFRPNDPTIGLMSATLPLTLSSSGRLVEGWTPTSGREGRTWSTLSDSERLEIWEYVQQQLSLLPIPTTFISASVTCFRRAELAPEGESQHEIRQQQVAFFDKAWKAFQAAPKMFQQDADIRIYMELCFALAASSLWRLGDHQRAKEVCDTAISFNTSLPAIWTMRGILKYPSSESLTDLEHAVKINDQDYFPYYYLAHYALENEEYDRTRKLIDQALRCRPSRLIEGQLYGWLAICLARQRAPAGDIEKAFGKARELAPELREIAVNYQFFQNSMTKTDKPMMHDIDKSLTYNLDDLFTSDREQKLRAVLARRDTMKQRLMETTF